MNGHQKYYMKLLEGRAKRLNELLEVAAPTDMIYKEIMLLCDAAKPFAPKPQWGTPLSGYGSWGKQDEKTQECGSQQCATG